MAIGVADIMVPLEEYAVVDEDATVVDALRALQSSQEKLEVGRAPHRAILVRDRNGVIVGKLHHFAFLRALVERFGGAFKTREVKKALTEKKNAHAGRNNHGALPVCLCSIRQPGRVLLFRQCGSGPSQRPGPPDH